jgi:hypothetical protein
LFFQYPYKLQKSDGSFLTGYKNYFSKIEDAQKSKASLIKDGISVEIVHTGNEWGQWYEWGFFRVRGYKKGTMHFEFISEDVWYKFNQEVAKIRGWNIPQQTNSGKKTKR